MTHHATARHLSWPTEREQVLAVFGFPGLADLTGVLPAGRATLRADFAPASPYPPLLRYAVAVSARIYGSQRRALQELQYDEDLWEAATQAYRDATGVTDPLPHRPPTARQQDYFVHQVSDDRDLMESLSWAFTAGAVRQARLLGNFVEAALPGSVAPDLRDTVVGVETWYAPFSKVREAVDPVTGEVALRHSQAQYSPRIQRTHSPQRGEGPPRLGINHLSLLTPTEAGVVVLGSRQSLAASPDPRRTLVAQVERHLWERLPRVTWAGDLPPAVRPVTSAASEPDRTLEALRDLGQSYNAWVRSRLGPWWSPGRAMRLSVPAQFLDHLCSGTLTNAITAWRAERLCGGTSAHAG